MERREGHGTPRSRPQVYRRVLLPIPSKREVGYSGVSCKLREVAANNSPLSNTTTNRIYSNLPTNRTGQPLEAGWCGLFGQPAIASGSLKTALSINAN